MPKLKKHQKTYFMDFLARKELDQLIFEEKYIGHRAIYENIRC